MNRKLGASIAALALATGLVACSNEADDAANTTEVEVTETNVETVTSTTGSAAASEETSASATAAEGETVELTTQNGEKVLVPAAAAKAAQEYGMDNWGDPINVESRADAVTLIEYDAEKNIVYSEKTGAYPIVGEISRVWKENGGLDNEIGLPTEAESKRDDNNGWIQNFENGTIEWLEQNGAFSERIS